MHNKTIAKLLSKENITIQHGNYKTAWFDVKDRVLGLPAWKDMPKDTYDLFIGHEVGHALYTPYEGWHDSPEKIEGVPRSYMNVIEDARIERFVQKDYPGLVGPFKRGYKNLLEQGFFSDLTDINWDEVKLIDKINIKAKLGDLVTVPFTSEEMVFFKRAMSNSTFEEVVQLCREILAWTQENQEELLSPPPETEEGDLEIPEGEDEGPTPGHDDYLENTNEEEQSEKTDSSSSEDDNETTEGEENGEGEESPDQEPSSETESEQHASHGDVDNSITDEIFRRAEKDLLDQDKNGDQITYMREPNKMARDQIIKSFKDLRKDRRISMNRNIEASEIKALEYWAKEFPGYMKQVRKSANFAVKEFEMRKAAYQWTRAQTAKSGSLDVNKVHAYKYSEDIFARVTQLADAKNHGMFMLIDYSGSMCSTLDKVIDQLMHLVVFCKTVNIPFEVYAFTTGNTVRNQIDGEVDMHDVFLTQLVSSTLNKKDYEAAMQGLYLKKIATSHRNRGYWNDDQYDDPTLSEWNVTGKCEEYGSTPLNDALILSHKMIKQFKAKHAVQKMNLVVLSDGDSNGLSQYKDYDKKIDRAQTSYYSGVAVEIDGKVVRAESMYGRSDLTKVLLENIAKRYNVQTLGFFISDDHHSWRSKLSQCGVWDTKDANKEFRKHKCVTFQDRLGYNQFYLVKGRSHLSTQEDEFDVDADASTAKIRTAFKKFATSKKNNKTLLSNFGKAVA